MKTEHKVWGAIAVLFVILAVGIASKVQAQDNWVKCRYNLDGTIQSFPGTQCPNSWHPV
jgi:hypothetical protein